MTAPEYLASDRSENPDLKEQHLAEFEDTLAQMDARIDRLVAAGDPDGEVPGLIHYRYRIGHTHQQAIVYFDEAPIG